MALSNPHYTGSRKKVEGDEIGKWEPKCPTFIVIFIFTPLLLEIPELLAVSPRSLSNPFRFDVCSITSLPTRLLWHCCCFFTHCLVVSKCTFFFFFFYFPESGFIMRLIHIFSGYCKCSCGIICVCAYPLCIPKLGYYVVSMSVFVISSLCYNIQVFIFCESVPMIA